jgi:aspartyl-tRNA(Asn)/glutamyl-tRNA(Gln) amidotransferase subunit A
MRGRAKRCLSFLLHPRPIVVSGYCEPCARTHFSWRYRLSQMIAYRRFWIDRMNMIFAEYDAVICPTVACIAPEIASIIDDDENFFLANSRVLRNTGWVNSLDGCAITLPCHARGSAPVGLQLVGAHARDAHVLALAAAVERVI